jgi:hypothetical protein
MQKRSSSGGLVTRSGGFQIRKVFKISEAPAKSGHSDLMKPNSGMGGRAIIYWRNDA